MTHWAAPVRHASLAVLFLAMLADASACVDSRPAERRSRVVAAAQPVPAPAAVPSGPVVPAEASCADTLETKALECAEGVVVRRGDTLTIALQDGGVVHRLDNRLRGEGFVDFAYAGRLGGSSGTPVFHVLEIQGTQSFGVELINARTGDSVVVADRPLISPDGARFAVGDMDVASCAGARQLEVWRITGDVPAREFTLTPYDCARVRGWGASELAWIAPDTLSFLRTAVPLSAARRARAEYDTSRARLVRGSSGWSLDRRFR